MFSPGTIETEIPACLLYKMARCPHFRGRIVSVNGNAIYT